MIRKVLKIAPHDNRKARKEAEYVCRDSDRADEVQIQAAIDVASEIGTDVRLEPGTYRILNGITLKGVNVSGATEGIRFETPLGEKLAEGVKSEIKEGMDYEQMWERLREEIKYLQVSNQSLPFSVILKLMDLIKEVYNVGRNKRT